MVSGIFTVPLGGQQEQAAENRLSPPVLQHYVGSSENQLVDVAVTTLFALEEEGNRVPASVNPVVFFGPPGSGKSLLVAGMGNRWQAQYPSSQVLSWAGADFYRNLAEAIQANGVEEFRSGLESADLLVIDDVHLVAGRQPAEEFLCCVIDSRIAASRPSLFSLDQSPATHPTLSQRLASRLLTGLSVPLALPGDPARQLILQQLADRAQISVSEDASQTITQSTPGRDIFRTPLQLRQLVQWLIAHGHGQLDQQSATCAVNHFDQARRPSMKLIASIVSRQFNIPVSQLSGPSRKRFVVRARGAAMVLCRRYSGKSFSDIGKFFGGRDHSTVMHACRKAEETTSAEAGFAKTLEQLGRQLSSLVSLEDHK